MALSITRRTCHKAISNLCSTRLLHTSYTRYNNAAAAQQTNNKVDISLIKQLRDSVGAPMSECKNALQHAISQLNNNTTDKEQLIDAAIEYLRKSGKLAAAKKSTKTAAEGVIGIYVDNNNNTATITEINSETDFAAKNDKFIALAQSICNAITNNSNITGNITVDDINTINTNDNKTIQDTLTDTVTSLRENIVIRRSFRTQANANQIISNYIHNSISSSSIDNNLKLGKSGAIIVLNTSSDVQLTDGQKSKIQELGQKLCMHTVALSPLYVHKHDIPTDVLDNERSVLYESMKSVLSSKNEQQRQKIIDGKLNKYYEENVLTCQKFVVVSQDDKSQTVQQTINNLAKSLNIKDISIDSVTRYKLGETVEKVDKMSFADEVKSKMG